MRRGELIEMITRALGRRQVIWFGTRAEDAISLSDLPGFDWSFALQGHQGSRMAGGSVALEDFTGRRVDLDTYDIDEHLLDDEVGRFRLSMLRALSRPSCVLPYRATTFLSSIGFSSSDRCRILGMFRGHQEAFEHKPWMEMAVAELDIPRIKWRYVADNDQMQASSMLEEGPVMLRQSRSTGGVGLRRVERVEDLPEEWTYGEEAFLSVAPFVDGGLPVNVGAVIWDHGVTLHPGSVQLIGVEGCTPRPFGFCGNDFARFLDLDESVIDAIEDSTRAVGALLHSLGFRGAFGVDFLIKDNVPLFMEVNPRFQGSTHLSARIAREADESCLLLDHIGALLGLPVPAPVRLFELSRWEGRRSHLVFHSLESSPARIDPRQLTRALIGIPALIDVDQLTSTELWTEPGGVVLRAVFSDSISADGFQIIDEVASVASGARGAVRIQEFEIPSLEGIR